jgi:hypothetical protein
MKYNFGIDIADLSAATDGMALVRKRGAYRKLSEMYCMYSGAAEDIASLCKGGLPERTH